MSQPEKKPARSATTATFRPRGAALELLRTKAPEVLIAGAAGTGKSIACLWKLHFLASRIPGVRLLIVRKTRESLTESGLVTLEDKVFPQGHPAMAQGGQRKMRQSYNYPNGSVIVVGGMDKPIKVMSTDYDCVYVQEATELLEHDWESLTTRLRNDRMPYQQIIADANPDRPTHWLKQRCDQGRTVMLESQHTDNPTLWNADKQIWTPAGTEYIAKLDALTGPRKQRLRFGRWVQAEGQIYDTWDPKIHVVDRFPIPKDWPRYLAIDFGFTNPFVAQWWCRDPDDRLYMYRELMESQRLVEDIGKQIFKIQKYEPPLVAVICDHDAEGRATLERYLGQRTTAAIKKEVAIGIQAVKSRLLPAGDGKPRLMLMRNALMRRCRILAEAKKPTSLAEEFDGYVWNTNSAKAEEPLKENDHGADACRYLISYFDLKPRKEMWLR